MNNMSINQYSSINNEQRTRNLETYSIVIFSQDLRSLNEFQMKLKRLIDYITIFDTQDDVKNYIQQNEYDLIILIVSIELGETIIKCTHDLKQLYQIYVYNPTNAISPWTNDYKKIQAVVGNSDALTEGIQTKFNELSNNEESFLKFDRFTTVNWYIQFIQLLINLNEENNDRQPLIDHLKRYYANSQTDLEKIRKFEHEYSSSAAVNWYTRDSFVYRILNKAFRSLDFEILILFRFFIVDLYQQLHNLYDKNNTSREVTYYRGQKMYKNEIKGLKEDQRIFSTSFFSTTCNRDLALIFAGSSGPHISTDGLQSVLFNIRPFHFNYNRLILANISNLSNYGDDEQEVLFAVGSCFRIGRVCFDKDIATWIIDLENDYVQDEIGKFNRPFHIDIITIGFYLFVEDDNFQSAQIFYNIVLKEANSLLWILSCYVGLGLIEYYKKNYLSALEKFENVIKTIDEENLWKTCEMIGNIFCILGNVYREMNNYDKALEFYKKAAKIINIKYFIEKDRCFWDMFIYQDKFNPFVKDDKYFYYCDRPNLNMTLLYKRTQQWNLARDIFQTVFNDYFERTSNGEVEMFVKILGYNKENSNLYDLIERNRAFLGGKTLALFLDEHHKKYVLYAYDDLGRHYLNHNCPDHAFVCYQEILQGEMKIETYEKLQSLYGIGRVYEIKQEYTEAVNWFKKAMDIAINNISKIDSSLARIYEKILLIYNEKLSDPLLSIVYMKEIINNLINDRDGIDEIYHSIATIYKITVQFYHSNDKSKIELICDHIHQVLDKIKINDQGWKKWLCIGSICDLKRFKDNYHRCDPIIDENYNVYLKFYKKIFDILSSNNTSDKLKTEIRQCEQFLYPLKLAKLDRITAVFKRWTLPNEQMNLHLKLTRSLSQSSFFISTIEHHSN